MDSYDEPKSDVKESKHKHRSGDRKRTSRDKSSSPKSKKTHKKEKRRRRSHRSHHETRSSSSENVAKSVSHNQLLMKSSKHNAADKENNTKSVSVRNLAGMKSDVLSMSSLSSYAHRNEDLDDISDCSMDIQIEQPSRRNSREHDFDDIPDVDIKTEPTAIKSEREFEDISDGSLQTPTRLKVERRSRSRSLSPAKIKVERLRVHDFAGIPLNVKTESRPSSPCPTVIKCELQRERSNSREQDFDNISERAGSSCSTVIKREIRRSRSNSREHDFDEMEVRGNRSNSLERDFDELPNIPEVTTSETVTTKQKESSCGFLFKSEPRSRSNSIEPDDVSVSHIQSAVKIEPRPVSPCPTVIKTEPGRARSNSREHDFDEIPIKAERELDSPQQNVIACAIRVRNFGKTPIKNEPELPSSPARKTVKTELQHTIDYNHFDIAGPSSPIELEAGPSNCHTTKVKNQNHSPNVKFKRSRSASSSSSSDSEAAGPSHAANAKVKRKRLSSISSESSDVQRSHSKTKLLNQIQRNDQLQKAVNVSNRRCVPLDTMSLEERLLREKAKQLEEIEQLILIKGKEELAAIDKKIVIEGEHTKREIDQYYIDLYETDNIDDWDDDPALSNVPVAQVLRKQRMLLMNQMSEPPLRRSIADQLFCREIETFMLPECNADLKALILKETDYEKMEIKGRLTEIERRYAATAIPGPLMVRIKEEKTRISEIVRERLMVYYVAGRIQPKYLFSGLARKISHVFYNQKSDVESIQRHINEIFHRLNCVTNLKDIDESKFL